MSNDIISIVATVVLGIAAIILGIVVYGKQKRQGERQVRFLENVAANRHNSADITMSGTSVTPGTGEGQFEGHAPPVSMAPLEDTRNSTESKQGGIL